jgi:hypothetical protein
MPNCLLLQEYNTKFAHETPIEAEMKIKSLLRYSYRVIEFLFILSITAGIVSMGLSSHDSAEMIGMLMTNIGAMAWLWFISLPLLLIVFVSFLRCSIPPLSIYKKVVLLLHLLNVVLWFVFYVILPKPEPCDAAIMEKHYKNHHDDMYDLVRYVRSSLDDSCSIVLQYRDNEVQTFTIANNSERKTCTGIKDQQELEKILQTVGLSIQELAMIQEKMHKAGIIGIDIEKNSISRWMTAKSELQFRWFGNNIYQFALYDHPMTETEKDDVLRLHQFILYNDSVVFESYGGYPGGRGFPDKDKFQPQEN